MLFDIFWSFNSYFNHRNFLRLGSYREVSSLMYSGAFKVPELFTEVILLNFRGLRFGAIGWTSLVSFALERDLLVV